MPRIKGTKTIVGLSIDTNVVERIDELAAAQGYSRSRMIEELVLGGLEGQETVIKAFANPTIMKAFAQAFSDRHVLRAMAEAVTEKVQPDQLELFKGFTAEVAEELTRMNAKARRPKKIGPSTAPAM